jgi:hypothetical protein
MPKKKERILALEVIETNTTWDYRQSKILQNFVCKKDEAEKVIADMDLQEYWKHEKKYGDEVKAILAAPGTRNASNVFFHDEVIVEEPKLPPSIKTGTKYVYKIYDYSGDKTHTEYGTQKDILSYISKKIKTKYAYVSYNGFGGRIEYSPKTVADIFEELEKTTSQLSIEPLGRSGTTDDSMVVAIFKNCVK